jgi:hypothetical protein
MISCSHDLSHHVFSIDSDDMGDAIINADVEAGEARYEARYKEAACGDASPGDVI